MTSHEIFVTPPPPLDSRKPAKGGGPFKNHQQYNKIQKEVKNK